MKITADGWGSRMSPVAERPGCAAARADLDAVRRDGGAGLEQAAILFASSDADWFRHRSPSEVEELLRAESAEPVKAGPKFRFVGSCRAVAGGEE